MYRGHVTAAMGQIRMEAMQSAVGQPESGHSEIGHTADGAATTVPAAAKLAGPKLAPDEIARYTRHLVLREVGGSGQQALKAARVLIVGAGGLGSPIALYLAAAGVGTIGLVDDDHVSLSNLQRQIAHGTPDINRPKVDSARDAIGRLNPHVTVETHAERLTAGNAMRLVERYDLVADGSDNFATRYLINDACFFAKRPLVFGALGRFDGYVSTFRAFETDAQGMPRPSYRCLFPEAPPPGTVPNCAEVGILGAVAGIVGTIMAAEVLKELLGIGDSLTGRLLMIDTLASRFETLTVGWDPDNPLNGTLPTILDLSGHA
jgi:molybdopterin-synthase adenylyltransferase